MPKRKVLLPATMAQAGWKVVQARGDIEAVPFDMNIPTVEFHRLLADAQGVGLSLTAFGEAELKAAHGVQVVARHGVGYDMVNVPALTMARVPLMITGVANSPSVAEQSLYLMLELAKHGTAFDTMVRENRWNQRMAQGLPVDLFEKTLLIIGFGKIGSRLGKMCLGLDMTVCAYDPYVDAANIRAAGCNPEANLGEALAKADFVSINCPKTQETNGMIAEAQLARMKPTAFIVNTARGGIIHEPSLHKALTTGVIKAAGLDVLKREPPDSNNPLLQLPNVVFAPHMAGVTRESLDRMAVSLVTNVMSVLDGKPEISNVVNKEIYGHR
ncbi:MAG: NAD(P)-dependent oxidoreductase [Burkholderiales bacterium]